MEHVLVGIWIHLLHHACNAYGLWPTFSKGDASRLVPKSVSRQLNKLLVFHT